MRDLGGALVQGHEARLDQPLEQRPHGLGRGPLGDELIDVDPSPSVLHIVAELGEAQEHAAQQRAVGFGVSASTASAVWATAELTPPVSW